MLNDLTIFVILTQVKKTSCVNQDLLNWSSLVFGYLIIDSGHAVVRFELMLCCRLVSHLTEISKYW